MSNPDVNSPDLLPDSTLQEIQTNNKENFIENSPKSDENPVKLLENSVSIHQPVCRQNEAALAAQAMIRARNQRVAPITNQTDDQQGRRCT